MLLLGRRSAEEKVAAFLLNLQSRYGRIGAMSVTVPLPMSRQDIADYLGLTIETVSRTMTRLAREKAVVIVPDGVLFGSSNAHKAIRRMLVDAAQSLEEARREAFREHGRDPRF